MTVQLTPLETELVNGWQKGFPLVSRPYARIARKMDIEEQEVIDLLRSLKERGILSRVGAAVRPNTVGASTLVAMRVPEGDLDRVAAIICKEPKVNHNYERENELNLWFVITASDLDELDMIMQRIATKSGYKPIKLPLETAFHIDLGFRL